jgi:hypothetical protein
MGIFHEAPFEEVGRVASEKATFLAALTVCGFLALMGGDLVVTSGKGTTFLFEAMARAGQFVFQFGAWLFSQPR